MRRTRCAKVGKPILRQFAIYFTVYRDKVKEWMVNIQQSEDNPEDTNKIVIVENTPEESTTPKESTVEQHEDVRQKSIQSKRQTSRSLSENESTKAFSVSTAAASSNRIYKGAVMFQ